MTDTMLDRGPDGIRHWTAGPVGLGHCMLRTTPQSLVESQPLRSEAGDLCLTMDGRVDNRDDLARALGGTRQLLRDLSDADLLLRSYQRWGTGGVRRIIGDFAFALWDGARHQLICGRDFLGKRPFYYSLGPRSFRFASEPQAVLVDRTVPREPNEGMVAEFLSVQVTSTTETLFRHLLRLPPAHLMVVTPEGAQVRRYWDWNPRAEIRHRNDDEYAAHLLEVCDAATEPRLASPWPLALALSGGVDSSSVLGAVRHLREGGRYDGAMEVFAMVYPGRDCDESPYIRAMAQDHHLDVHEFNPAPVGAAPYEAQVRRHLDLSDYPTGMMHRGYLAAARKLDCRVLLTGNGPDEWFTGSELSLADRLRRGRLRGLMADVRTGAGSSSPRAMAEHLMRFGLLPNLPDRATQLVRSAAGRTACPNFLRPSFCQGAKLEDRALRRTGRRPTFASAATAAHLSDGWQAHAHEVEDRAMASAGLESRDPFADRRVVEFALAIPDEQRSRAGVTKFVLRQAMAGLIPDSVRMRSDKGNYSHLFCEELRLQGGAQLFVDLELDQRGWVDGQRLSAMYEHLDASYRAGDPAYHRHLWPLWLVVAVERWLRATIP